VNGDPVSWFMIEPGWDVVGSDGEELGSVHEVLGETDSDIFDGLAVVSGVMKTPTYVPAERVGPITEGRIELDLVKAEFERLGEHRGRAPGNRS
jgi:hypothetical protein